MEMLSFLKSDGVKYGIPSSREISPLAVGPSPLEQARILSLAEKYLGNVNALTGCE